MSFVRNLDGLKNGVLPRAESEEEIVPLQPSGFTLLSEECETYKIEKGECIFKDSHGQIQKAAPELSNLTGIRMDLGDAMNGGIHTCL